MNLPLPAREDKAQVVKNEKIPFLDMKMSWYPEGDLQCSVFKKKGQQLKYIGMEITHTPGTLRAISYGVLNCLEKRTFAKTLVSF